MAFNPQQYGYGAAVGAYAGVAGGDEQAAGAYNPRYHYQAAQNAGFNVGTDDGQPRTLYVGNLDPSVSEEFITALFGQIGLVTKTKVIFDNTNRPCLAADATPSRGFEAAN